MKAILISAVTTIATSDTGVAYIITGAFGTPADTPANPTRSLLHVFENCGEIGPAHSLLSDVRTIGLGRFIHSSANDGSGEALHFSATDNTDPRTNGRVYTYFVGSIPVVPVPDTTPPTVAVITPGTAATVSGSQVAIAANASDNVGIASVSFNVDGQALPAVAVYSYIWDTTLVSNGAHTVTATARDAAGNVTVSTAIPVTVNNADTTPPTVSITAPTTGATVSGASVAVSANAADNVGVVGVQFKLDGANLGAEDTTSPYAVVWDSTAAANGAHALTAVARDAAGNTTTSAAISVTVNNVSSSCVQVALNVIGAGESDGGFAYLVPGSFGTPPDSSAAPNQSTLRLFENGVALGPAHSLHSDIRTLGLGRFSHWIGEAIHFSASDNTDPRANGKTYTYCVPSGVGDTTPPTVSITAPAALATVSGANVTVSANASDNVGVVGVQFKVDGTNLGAEDTTSPYTVTWNSATVSNGSHTLTAVARDAAGNTATSSAVVVTVSNPAAAKKTLLYGSMNSGWLAATASRWANSGVSGIIIPGYLTWSSTPTELAFEHTYAVALNAAGAQYGLTDNYYSVNISTANPLPAWQDTTGWAQILANFTNLANFALTSGSKGLVIDTEPYGYQLWDSRTSANSNNAGLSKAQLQPYVRQRGHDVMLALQQGFPGIQIILLQEGALWSWGVTLSYDLWPDFYNGLASVQAQPGIIVGAESTYPEQANMALLNADPAAWINNTQYPALRDAMLQPAIENPAYWTQYGSYMLGMWPLGVDYTNKSGRYSPAVFKAQFAAYKALSGPYVFVYGHGSAWWQMTQAEVNTYSNNPTHYTNDQPNQVVATASDIQSYINVLNGTA